MPATRRSPPPACWSSLPAASWRWSGRRAAFTTASPAPGSCLADRLAACRVVGGVGAIGDEKAAMTSPWTPDRWHAATAQLGELLELPVPERGARLEALRERDRALADDVDALLRDHDAARAADFLEQDANALLTATAT